MHYNQSCAAKGNTHGNRAHLFNRSMQRASVNIFKNANSYEMLVFAPGRIREHFHLEQNGAELTVSYTPPEGFEKPEWILREYSRGGFSRTFTLDKQINSEKISAKYADGVLYVSLPLVEGAENPARKISIS